MKTLRFLLMILAAAAFAACTPENMETINNPSGKTDGSGTGEGGDGGDGGEAGGQSGDEEATLIYYEDLDADPSYTGYLSNENWHHATGQGASNVQYATWNANVRNDNYGSAGNIGTYEGASGKCYARLTEASSGNKGYLTISGIATGGFSEFRFSFGAAQGPEVMSVEYSTDGSTFTPLNYSFDSNYNHWSKVSTTFSLQGNPSSLILKLTLIGAKASYAYGANFDDLKLEGLGTAGGGESGGGQGGDGGQGGSINKYAELPAFESNTDYYYNTLYTTTVTSRKKVRNYSFCYDTRRHNPIWVAYPMHSIYAEGSGRSKDEAGNDPWMQYPDLPLEQQSIIWNIGDGYQYWSRQCELIDGGSWTKGHLCMSSSRSGENKEINLQTFYPVNIAPQSNKYAGAGIFGELWGKTEDFHWQRGSQICSDTLYVVAGCHYANDNNIEYDACYGNTHSSYSKQCVMPTHQYKLFVRTRSGISGKAVQNCQASELKAIGFWFDSVLPVGSSTSVADYAMSIADIEQITGITFFPGIPAEVKSQCTLSDWNL